MIQHPVIDDVVKVGGSLMRERDNLARLMEVLADAPRRLLVVAGGGALADAVRRVHAEAEMSEVTAHRMALLTLDQSALWLAELARGGRRGEVVRSAEEVERVLRANGLPVLAPSIWLEQEDALPPSWQVTSDSVAAWVAGRLRAQRLFLLKAFRFRGPQVVASDLGDEVDAFFLRALPTGIECRFMDGRSPEDVRRALGAGREQGNTDGEETPGTLLVRTDFTAYEGLETTVAGGPR